MVYPSEQWHQNRLGEHSAISFYEGVGIGGVPVEVHEGTSSGDVASSLINYLDILEEILWSTVEISE